MIGNIHQDPLNKSLAVFKLHTKSNKGKNIILGSINIHALHLKGNIEQLLATQGSCFNTMHFNNVCLCEGQKLWHLGDYHKKTDILFLESLELFVIISLML